MVAETEFNIKYQATPLESVFLTFFRFEISQQEKTQQKTVNAFTRQIRQVMRADYSMEFHMANDFLLCIN